MNHLVSRRRFLTGTTLGTAQFLILSRPDSVRGAAANEKLNLALIGVGGRGSWFLSTMPGLNTRFAALCDVHADRLAVAAQRFPEARTYTDFRQMLEEQQDFLDGVIVATPDHTHAVASARALAATTGRATQMGNWAVHSANLAFKAFRLDTLWRTELAEAGFPQGRRLRVAARMSEVLEDTFPKWELIEFEAPPRERLPAFRMTWCNGRAPGGRERIEEHLGRRLDWGGMPGRRNGRITRVCSLWVRAVCSIPPATTCRSRSIRNRI